MTSGVYCVTHIPSGKRYVGQSGKIEERWRRHYWAIKTKNHYFGRALNAHPKEEFKWEILVEHPDKEFLNLAEAETIDHWNTTNPDLGYNCAKGGNDWSPSTHPLVKEKLRIAHLGRKRGPMSEETKRKIGEGNRGKKATLEQRKNMSLAHIGKTYICTPARLNALKIMRETRWDNYRKRLGNGTVA